MPKLKSNKKTLTVKTGTLENFFSNAKKTMRALDENKPIDPTCTLTFTDPLDMLHFLTEKKMELINVIRAHPNSISNISKLIKRNRTSVCRDIKEMEKFGLVKTHEEINAGHGRHKIVELVSSKFKLEAYL